MVFLHSVLVVVITNTVAMPEGAGVPSTALSLSIGGDGGTGGAAGSVEVENDGLIITKGDAAHGIIAESIGGGGGNGGLTIAGNLLVGSAGSSGINSAVSVGGDGGTGNTGNSVVVNNRGRIETYGNKSHGIFAQSVGGGGGNGATAVAVSVDPTIVSGAASMSNLLSIGVGGSGGDGANGGDVTVNHSGSIATFGDSTYGIFAQSVGGGGGTSSFSFSSPFWMAADMLIPVIIGSDGSSNGTGGKVTVNSDGDIVTSGANSGALYSQSINGGGGDLEMFLDISQDAESHSKDSAGKSSSSFKGTFRLGSEGSDSNPGGLVENSHSGNVYTAGDNSHGISIQSIGGGGGRTHFSLLARQQADLGLQVDLGSVGSSNNAGGNITFERDGWVATGGSQAKGVSLQSIGGGGGSADVTFSRTAGVSSTRGSSSLSLQMGSVGGTGLDGGDINLQMAGDLVTSGYRAQGIMAQSIGAGGGEVRLTGMTRADVLLGGQGGAGGNGGTINLNNSGAIETYGDMSHAVFLQSVGGGGGALFTDLDESNIHLTLSNNGAGNGGNISFVQNGSIVTHGGGSYGAFLQSIGGGGGAIDTKFAGSSGGTGNGGNLDIRLMDDVLAYGRNSVGFFLQSSGGAGLGGDLDLLIGGSVIAGGDGATAVHAESSGSYGPGDITINVNGVSMVI